MEYIIEKTFEKLDFKVEPFTKGEYEYCNFINCDFGGIDLSNIVFLACEFSGCNLSLVKLKNTALRDIRFKDTKMLGLHFENCNDFGFAVQFENCTLNHSSFYQVKLKKTIFKNTSLQEVDFTECDLSNSVLDNCDLRDASFEKTNLEKVSFLTSFNYSIDPELNRMKKAKFSQAGIAGLLHKYDIEIRP